MEIETLYGKFHRDLLTYCTAMTRSRSSAEDLVQETYLRAFTPTASGISPPYWLTILTNSCGTEDEP